MMMLQHINFSFKRIKAAHIGIRLHALLLTILLSISVTSYANQKLNIDQGNIDQKPKILIVMTNHAKYPSREDKTGLWLTELTHFYDVVHAAGYDMDFISPNGGLVPIDERSQKAIYMDKQARTHLADQNFMARLQNTLKPSDVNAADYKAIYFTGGHGVMWDFTNQPELTALAEQIYRQGGVISAVCHGVAGLLALENEQGQPLIKDRKITGFSNEEETLSGMKAQVPFLLENELKAKGASYKQSVLPFTSYVVVDDRIITGQNPQSPREVAVKLIKRLDLFN